MANLWNLEDNPQTHFELDEVDATSISIRQVGNPSMFKHLGDKEAEASIHHHRLCAAWMEVSIEAGWGEKASWYRYIRGTIQVF